MKVVAARMIKSAENIICVRPIHGSAKAMYVDGYTTVPAELLELRPIILEKKKVKQNF